MAPMPGAPLPAPSPESARKKAFLLGVSQIFMLAAFLAVAFFAWKYRSQVGRMLGEQALERKHAWRMQTAREMLHRADRLGRLAVDRDGIDAARSLAEGAGGVLDLVLQDLPKHDEALLLSGRALELQGNLDGALDRYTESCEVVEAVKRRPDGTPVYFPPASFARGLLRVRELTRRTLVEDNPKGVHKEIREAAMGDLRRAMNQSKDYHIEGVALIAIQLADDAPAEAVSSAALQIEADRLDWRPLFYRGVARAWLKQDKEALEDFWAAIQIYPIAPEPHAWRGRVLARMDRRAAAIDALGDALARDSALPEAWLLRGRLLADDGRFAEAAEHFAAAGRLRPDDAAPALRHAECTLEAFVRGGSADPAPLEGAVAALSRTLGSNPGSVEGWMLRAKLHRARGALDAALSDASEALRLDESRIAAWTLKAEIRLATGDAAGAASDFAEAIRREPPAAELKTLRRRRAASLAKTGKPEEAVKEFDALIAEDPADVSLAIERLEALAAGGKAKQALEESEALLARGSVPRIRHLRARLHLDLKEPGKAVDEATAAWEADPSSIDPLLTRARAWAAHGNRAAADRDLEKALNLAPARKAEIERVRQELK